MKPYLKFLPLVLAFTALAGCSDKPHRAVVHHKHHVHKQTTLAVFYDTSTSTYWGSSNGVWYTYSTPGPLAPSTRTAPAPVTVVAAPPSNPGTSSFTAPSAPAAPSSNMSVPAGTTWGASTTTNRADPSAVSTTDSALSDKARMSGTFEPQPGGTWTRAANPPPDEDLVTAAVENDAVTIVTDDEGKPETEQEIEADNQQDSQMDAQEASEASSEGTSTEPSESNTSSESSDSSSSSSDSSSSGDSGGGGE